MATIIEFFVPSSFKKKATKWIRPEEYGKVIPFSLPKRPESLQVRLGSQGSECPDQTAQAVWAKWRVMGELESQRERGGYLKPLLRMSVRTLLMGFSNLCLPLPI